MTCLSQFSLLILTLLFLQIAQANTPEQQFMSDQSLVIKVYLSFPQFRSKYSVQFFHFNGVSYTIIFADQKGEKIKIVVPLNYNPQIAGAKAFQYYQVQETNLGLENSYMNAKQKMIAKYPFFNGYNCTKVLIDGQQPHSYALHVAFGSQNIVVIVPPNSDPFIQMPTANLDQYYAIDWKIVPVVKDLAAKIYTRFPQFITATLLGVKVKFSNANDYQFYYCIDEETFVVHAEKGQRPQIEGHLATSYFELPLDMLEEEENYKKVLRNIFKRNNTLITATILSVKRAEVSENVFHYKITMQVKDRIMTFDEQGLEIR